VARDMISQIGSVFYSFVLSVKWWFTPEIFDFFADFGVKMECV